MQAEIIPHPRKRPSRLLVALLLAAPLICPLSLKAADSFDNVRIERVGDCAAPRLIQSNIAEAFDVALTL